MNATITLQGLDILEKKLKQMEKAELRARKRAMLAGGNVIRDEARRRVRVRRGRLRRGIITKVNSDATEVKVGPSKRVYYGDFIERGTKFAPAYPFLKPAYEDKREEALQKIIEAEREELNKI